MCNSLDSSYFFVSNATADGANEITVMKTNVKNPVNSQRLYNIIMEPGRLPSYSSTVPCKGWKYLVLVYGALSV